MKIAVLFLAVLGADAQIAGGFHGRPSPVPAATQPARQQRQLPYARTRNLRGYGGGYYNHATEFVVETEAAPAKEDKLKELVVSPVYQKDKITPKIIEIP